MYITHIYIIDTIIGLLIGVSVFIWSGFKVMDSYWEIDEVDT
jgi:Co/Zn/Cd efflux system component